jgi:Fe-S cluster biogenesis protein NfuA
MSRLETFAHQMQRIEELIQQLEHSPDPQAQAVAREVVGALLDVHAAALAKMLDLLSRAGEQGRGVLDALAEDEWIRSILLLHDLHPEDTETRVRRALDQARPHLVSFGGDVEFVEMAGETLRLRMHCARASTATLRSLIESAVCGAAPEVTSIEVEEITGPPAASGLLQIQTPAR